MLTADARLSSCLLACLSVPVSASACGHVKWQLDIKLSADIRPSSTIGACSLDRHDWNAHGLYTDDPSKLLTEPTAPNLDDVLQMTTARRLIN